MPIFAAESLKRKPDIQRQYHPRVVDIGDFIRRHPHPQYNKYLDPRKFSRFTIDSGNVVWGKNWDLIFPIEQLYAGTIV